MACEPSHVAGAKGKARLAAWELPGGSRSPAGHLPTSAGLCSFSLLPCPGARCVLFPARQLGRGGAVGKLLMPHRADSRQDGSCMGQHVGSAAPRESSTSCAAIAKGISWGGGSAYHHVSSAGCVTVCSRCSSQAGPCWGWGQHCQPRAAMPDPGSTQVRAQVEMFGLEQLWTCLGAS